MLLRLGPNTPHVPGPVQRGTEWITLPGGAGRSPGALRSRPLLTSQWRPSWTQAGRWQRDTSLRSGLMDVQRQTRLFLVATHTLGFGGKDRETLREREQPGDNAVCLLPEAGQFRLEQLHMACHGLGRSRLAVAHATREQLESESTPQCATQHPGCWRRGSALGTRAGAKLPLPPRAFQKYRALLEATDDLRRA